MRKQWSFRALAVLLILSLLVTMSNRGLLSLGENTVSVKASGDAADNGLSNYITYNGTVDLSTLGNQPDAQDAEEAPQQTSPDEAPTDADASQRLYADGKIHIFNFRQMQLVGSDAGLTTGDDREETVGLGEPVTDENGEPVTYSGDASYFLEGDIALPDDTAWSLPTEFSGEFTSEERQTQDAPENGDAENGEDTDDTEDGESSEPADGENPGEAKNERLYDVESDTIYIQNIYQLRTLADHDRANIPVMTGDWSAEKFGIGQMIYPNGESGSYLTYSTTHRYVISSEFSAKQPEEVSLAVRGAETVRLYAQGDISHVDGRDYFGQPAVTIGDTEYILIGSRKQLDAINYGRTVLGERNEIEVYGPVFKVDYSRPGLTGDNWTVTDVSLEYPGDADLIDDTISFGDKTYTFGSDADMYDDNNNLIGTKTYHGMIAGANTGRTKTTYCTVNPETGKYDPSQTSNPFSSLKYTREGNYIVFRDINMGGEAKTWNPLTFQGTMIGAVASGNNKLWDDNHLALSTDNEKAVLSNIHVVPVMHDGKLDADAQMGVGFFATLSTGEDRNNEIGTFTSVKNLKLSGGKVINNCTESYVEQSAVNLLLQGTASGLGIILDPVLRGLLDKDDVNLETLLTELLTARKKDPSGLATGAFAGRVMGGVEISGCEVENIQVTAVKTTFEEDGKIVGKGGFVGYTQGSYVYDILSETVQFIVDTLADTLNVIPFLGLGDLIDVLLNNALPLGSLIPIGYNHPNINHCIARNVTLSQENGKYGVGGFAGAVCATSVTDSKVIGGTVTVKADHFGGGFAGVERDDIIRETLGDLGVNVGSLYPMSEIVHCSVDVTKLNVTGKSYLGGFVGVQANSYVIECDINVSDTVRLTASGDCIGGFTGSAQLGSSFGMERYLPGNGSLLGTVQKVLSQAASNDGFQILLALGGVSQSGIVGCRIYGKLDIGTSGSMAGGIVGKGEAVYIIKSSDIRLLGKYKDGKADPPATNGRTETKVFQLVRVRSEGNFAGGIAGHLLSANTDSLLGNTTGLKSYLGFLIADVEVDGVPAGYYVESDADYAGCAMGFAIGGDAGFSEDYALNLLSAGLETPYSEMSGTDKESYREEHLEEAVQACVSGNARKVVLNSLQYVKANNHVGGFAGTTGPDIVGGENGLDLSLLGLNVLKLNNLIGLTSGIHSNYGNCYVNGIDSGYTVEATGSRDEFDETDLTNFTAGGFAGDTTSVTMINCHANNLKSVTSDEHHGKSGGFVGDSAAGNLSLISAEKEEGVDLINIGQLLQMGSDLIPAFEMCDVHFVDGGFVKGNSAGGFAGQFRGGTVNMMDISKNANSPYAVYNIDHVLGSEFGGGFGGAVFSGALERNGGSGLSLLNGVADVDIGGITSLTNKYIPRINYAGVYSENGFTVLAAYVEDSDDGVSPAAKGYAGGYIGYGSGMEVSHCDVNKLRNRTPDHPADLEEKDGGAYMSFKPEGKDVPEWNDIPYSVAGAHFAGGYIGDMNVGSARALGDSIKLLKTSVTTKDLLKGFDIVVSTIEHSDVYGMPGGYSVLASSHVNLGDGKYDAKGIGYSGGFAGRMRGAHIQDSSANNFNYIVGEVASGGYAGEMQPGNVADVLALDGDDDPTIHDLLGDVIEADMISLVQTFVATVYNSRTTCIPCGGAVRAQSFSDSDEIDLPVQRGFAGGFVGHDEGGQIWGNSNAAWMGDVEYGLTDDEPKQPCDAVRIRSVYGAEYAGGYVGLMESASTASTGSLSLLGGVISADNLLGALDMVYPTIENANVYGPLEKLNPQIWKAWKNFVGQNSGFGAEIDKINEDLTQEELDEVIKQFIYGYHVVAGRSEFDDSVTTYLSGCAGGFAGAMNSGVIRYATANNAKQVRAMKAAGGFAGEMQTKGLAEFGGVSLLGNTLNLSLGQLVKAADVLVPVVFESGVTGYQNGLIVRALGLPTADISTHEGNSQSAKPVKTNGGYAGGFVGACYGGQIANRADGRIDLNDEEPDEGAWVRNLKTVTGTNCIGGFAGRTTAAAVANANESDASNGMVQGLLDTLIGNPGDLVSVLQATITVIGKAEVTAADQEWGFVVDGEYKDGEETKFASCAGGFVGSSEATVFGNKDLEERTLKVKGLRGASAAYYAGGFFGLAHVSSVAQVGDTNSSTNLLSLINADSISVLDIFRTYIYHATVTGVEDGIKILAHDQFSTGTMSTYQLSGAAGGFGGGMMNGTVQKSSVTGLNIVDAPNYSGGFLGISGTSGGIGSDGIEVAPDEEQQGEGGEEEEGASLLGMNLQLLNVVGSTFADCAVTGFDNGFVVRTTNVQTAERPDVAETDVIGSCAAGFAGYSEMAHFDRCTVESFKFAKGPQIAGGFVGRSALNYLVSLNVGSPLTELVVDVVDILVRALYLPEASRMDLINTNSTLAGLQVLSEGNLIAVNLFGMNISVSLENPDKLEGDNVVLVTLGSSTISLPCTENGVNNTSDISINLIEGNRTEINACSVKGIDDGYDVFAGRADDTHDGTEKLGYAGGFIGYNDGGRIDSSSTELCDVIRGTPVEEGEDAKIGPFTGYFKNRSRDDGILEGTSNSYSIYRSTLGGYTQADTKDGTTFGTLSTVTNGEGEQAEVTAEEVTIYGEPCNRYLVTHRSVVSKHNDLKDAVESGSTGDDRELLAYQSPALEILMLNVPLDDNGMDDSPITIDLKDPCDTEIELSVVKVWKDFLYLGTRPDHITVKIAKVPYDKDADVPARPAEMIISGSTSGLPNVTELTLDNVNGGDWSTMWKAQLTEKLPVAGKETVNGVEKTCYYQYVVEEVEFDNYKAYYEIDQDSATAKIINRYTGPIIPLTGGTGVLMFYAIGMFLLIGGGMLLIIRFTPDRRKKKLLGSADVELHLSDFSDFYKDLKKKKK